MILAAPCLLVFTQPLRCIQRPIQRLGHTPHHARTMPSMLRRHGTDKADQAPPNCKGGGTATVGAYRILARDDDGRLCPMNYQTIGGDAAKVPCFCYQR